MHGADKAVCVSKRGPLADVEMCSLTSSICRTACSRVAAEVKTRRVPTAAAVLNATNYSSHIWVEMGLDRLFLTDPRCTSSAGPTLLGGEGGEGI